MFCPTMAQCSRPSTISYNILQPGVPEAQQKGQAERAQKPPLETDSRWPPVKFGLGVLRRLRLRRAKREEGEVHVQSHELVVDSHLERRALPFHERCVRRREELTEGHGERAAGDLLLSAWVQLHLDGRVERVLEDEAPRIVPNLCFYELGRN